METTNLRILLALSATLMAVPGHCEDLRLVGTIDPIGVKVYADRESVSRRGHMSQVMTLAIHDPVRRPDTLPFFFDCDEGVFHLPDGSKPSVKAVLRWEKNGTSYSMSPQTLGKIFDVACKRSWEFWK